MKKPLLPLLLLAMKTFSVSVFNFRRLILKRLLTLALLLFSVFVFGQDKKWPSLLWEISGNGLTKPSYLYGTMHVSSKLAFHLGDPFFDALESVDLVALELHHEKWLAAELSEENLLELTSAYNSSGFGSYASDENDFERIFQYGLDSKDYLLSSFRFFPRFASYIVSRNRQGSLEYEEDSWLDYFIYKSGKKLKKEIFGLETFKESQYAMELATRYNREHREELEKHDFDWDGQNTIFEELESAYRKGDLDLLDSLSILTSIGGWKKYILEYRNEVFVGRIDSILKSKTMFIGMGAAHLPGETGVIEMLRDLGYTLKPVKPGRRNQKRIESLESKEYPATFQKYTSASGLFEIEVPGPVYTAPVSADMSVETSADLPNASSLYMIRCKTYAGLRKRSTIDILHSLDSLLYENVPGTIESQKELTINGYPAIDLLSKDRLGHFHRYRIISLNQELLVIRLDGHQKLAASRYGDRIFSSFKLLISESNDWKTLTVTDKSLTLSLPPNTIYHSMDFLQRTDNSLGISSYDELSGAFIQINRLNIPSYRMEPDQYEISEVEYAFRKIRKVRVLSKDTISYQGFPSLDCSYKNEDGSLLSVRYCLVGTYCYVFAIHNPNEELMSRIFDSISFSNPKYMRPFTIQTDSTIMASFEIPYKLPKEESEMNWYYGDSEEESNPFDARYHSSAYSPLEGGEGISVQYNSLGKYHFKEDSTKFEESRIKEFTGDDNLIVVSKELQVQDSTWVLNLILGDTSVQRLRYIKAIYQPSSTYELSAMCDARLGPSQFVQKFFNTFEPCDTAHLRSRFEHTTDLFLQDIQSDDSLTYRNAFDLLRSTWLKFDSSATIFSSMEKISKWATAEERRMYQHELMTYLVKFKDPEVLKFLTDRYTFWADSTDNQAFALTLLSDIETKEAVLRTRDLLIESAPLGIDFGDVYDIFRNLRDSVELSAGITASLFPLLEIEEYEQALYTHIGLLLDSAKISKKDYQVLFPTILNKSKIEYRRANARRNKVAVSDEYSYEGWNSSQTSFYDKQSMTTFWRLLLPYRDQKEVKEFFNTLEKTKHKDILISLVELYYQNNLQVSEQIIDSVCSDTDGKIELYEALHAMGKDSLFPTKYMNQDEILEHVLKQKFAPYSKDEVDSLVFLKCDPIQFRNKKGSIYYYKVLREEEDGWRLYCAGIIPDEHHTLITQPDFTKKGMENFDPEKMSAEELEDAYEELQRKAINELVKNNAGSNERWTDSYYED